MITNIKNSEEITQQIEAQESELKELLSRAMKNPLQPLMEQTAQLAQRLQSIEDFSQETSIKSLPAVQATIRQQGEEAQKNFRGLRKTITDDLPELLTECLASAPQDIARLLEIQISVNNLLNQIQQEQILQNSASGQVFDNITSQINENFGNISKNLGSLKTEVQAEAQQIGNGVATLIANLNCASIQIAELTSMLAQRTDELTSKLEISLTAFQTQSEKNKVELLTSLQVVQKRFFWLSALCGLCFTGSVGLIANHFILHIY